MARRARFYYSNDSNYDINLAPMLDIIVSIVPMLLLSAVFFKITVIDTKVPQPTTKTVAEDKKKDKDVTIKLALSKQKGMELAVVDSGKTNRMVVGAGLEESGLVQLRSEVLKVKQQYPDVFQIELDPDEDITYAEIVKVMDRIRNRSDQDPKISFVDKESGKTVETDLLFPDVVFANAVGG